MAAYFSLIVSLLICLSFVLALGYPVSEKIEDVDLEQNAMTDDGVNFDSTTVEPSDMVSQSESASVDGFTVEIADSTDQRESASVDGVTVEGVDTLDQIESAPIDAVTVEGMDAATPSSSVPKRALQFDFIADIINASTAPLFGYRNYDDNRYQRQCLRRGDYCQSGIDCCGSMECDRRSSICRASYGYGRDKGGNGCLGAHQHCHGDMECCGMMMCVNGNCERSYQSNYHSNYHSNYNY
eukprot:GHVS01066336.1.p1 GENE.GHVS01066336.1~~GHVS01066336.1.p1  ORF type:complete len:240 (+),score=29.15 GHVS01066336.1:144-863(+)